MAESFTDSPLLTERFDRALHLATAHHARQLRKGTPVPYAAHLLAVASLALEMHGDDLWARFGQGQGLATRVYYRELATAFERERERMGPYAGPAVDELRRVVDAITALAEEHQGPDTRVGFP